MFKKILIAALTTASIAATMYTQPVAACAWSEARPDNKRLRQSDLLVVRADAVLQPEKGIGEFVRVKKLRGKGAVPSAFTFDPNADPDMGVILSCGAWRWTTAVTQLSGVFYLRQTTGGYVVYEFKAGK